MKTNDGVQDSFATGGGRSQSVAAGGSGTGVDGNLEENLVEETLDDEKDDQVLDKN